MTPRIAAMDGRWVAECFGVQDALRERGDG